MSEDVKRITDNVIKLTDYVYEDEPSLIDVDDLFRNLDTAETRIAEEQRLSPADAGLGHMRMVYHHLKQLSLHDVDSLYTLAFELGVMLQEAEIVEEYEDE